MLAAFALLYLSFRGDDKTENAISMIIPNPVIKLDYNPARDVLLVDWPDFREYSLSEAKYTLDVIIETLKLYDVKYILSDTRKGVIEIPEQQYKELLFIFANDLKTTRVQKLARIVNDNTLREKPINEVKTAAQVTIPVESFYSEKEAMNWLISTN